MSINDDIATALDTWLLTVTGLPSAVAFDNYNFAPTKGQPYVVPTLMPAEPDLLSGEPDLITEERGIYQVSLFYPVNVGPAIVRRMADTVANHFKVGTKLMSGGHTVRIKGSWAGQIMPEPSWVHIPVTVLYDAFVSNA